MEFEKLKKKKFPTDRPIPEKQGRVRENKNIFKVGPIQSDKPHCFSLASLSIFKASRFLIVSVLGQAGFNPTLLKFFKRLFFLLSRLI